MRFQDFSKEALKAIKKQTKGEITRLCLTCETEAKKSMEGGGRPHTPSRPGEPPHVDTGRLRSSITHEVEETLTGIVGRVGTNVVYGRFLELGTSKMKARPFLRPALRRTTRGEKKYYHL